MLLSFCYTACMPFTSKISLNQLEHFLLYPEEGRLNFLMYTKFRDNLTNNSNYCLKYARIQVFTDQYFYWPVFSCKRTEPMILSLYGKMRVSDNPYPRIFYIVVTMRGSSYEISHNIFNSKLASFLRRSLCSKTKITISRYISLWYTSG